MSEGPNQRPGTGTPAGGAGKKPKPPSSGVSEAATGREMFAKTRKAGLAGAKEAKAAVTSVEGQIAIAALTAGTSTAATAAGGAATKAAGGAAAKSAGTKAAGAAASEGAKVAGKGFGAKALSAGDGLVGFTAKKAAVTNGVNTTRAVGSGLSEAAVSEAARARIADEAKSQVKKKLVEGAERKAVDAAAREFAPKVDRLHQSARGGQTSGGGTPGAPGGKGKDKGKGKAGLLRTPDGRLTESDHNSYLLRTANRKAQQLRPTEERKEAAKEKQNQSFLTDHRSRAEKINDKNTARTGVDAVDAAGFKTVKNVAFQIGRQNVKRRRTLFLVLAAAFVALVMTFGTMMAGILGAATLEAGDVSASAGSGSCLLPDGSVSGNGTSNVVAGSLNAEQTANVATIIGIAKGLGLGENAMKIGVITAMQESTLGNPNYGDRDSLGMFQQRALWAPAEKRMNIQWSTTMFYTGGEAGQRGLIDVPGWSNLAPWEASQSVQASFDTAAKGSNGLKTYGRWVGLADQVVPQLIATTPAIAPLVQVDVFDTDGDLASCPTDPTGVVGGPVSTGDIAVGGGGASTANIPCAPGTADAGLSTGPGNVPIRLCTVIPGLVVDTTASASAKALIDASNAAGINLKGSSFRSNARQIELRKAHCGSGWATVRSSSCRPPTALPGKSQHEWGLAIDFSNCSSRGTACYNWLAANAANYNYKNLPSESWHWSTTGN